MSLLKAREDFRGRADAWLLGWAVFDAALSFAGRWRLTFSSIQLVTDRMKSLGTFCSCYCSDVKSAIDGLRSRCAEESRPVPAEAMMPSNGGRGGSNRDDCASAFWNLVTALSG